MPNSTERPILVIGATGRHGRTGSVVVDQLFAHHRQVRVLSRSDDARTADLRRRGATTVVADLHDRTSLAAALDDVAAVYFTYPIAAGVIPAAANLASVLVETGRRPHVVVMSMVAARLDSPSRLGQAQAVAEDVLIWAGLNPTVLRVAALFHENVLTLHGDTIRSDALIANSFGQGRAPWIGGRDAAELAVAELLRPAPAEPAISYPPAAETLSHSDIADIISVRTGRHVRYEYAAQTDWRHQLERQGASGQTPVNAAMAQHISAIGASFAGGRGPVITPDPETLTHRLGHAPATFAEFVDEHLTAFSHQS